MINRTYKIVFLEFSIRKIFAAEQTFTHICNNLHLIAYLLLIVNKTIIIVSINLLKTTVQ